MEQPAYLCTLMLTYGCNLNCVYCFEKYKDPHKRMSIATAKSIVDKEIHRIHDLNQDAVLKFDLFGGEPLLCFPLIKELCEWAWQQDYPLQYYFSITTNGTLLNDNIKDWLRQHKERISLVMSIDGDADTQRKNRGCNSEQLPTEFIHETWPESHLKATASKDSLQTFGDDVIYWLERGYNIEGSIAMGVRWTKEDALVYKRELEKIANYYLEHPSVVPMHIFNQPLARVFTPQDEFPQINCGIGRTSVLYNYDGTEYPCHMLLPVTTGDAHTLDKIKDIDWTDNERFFDPECKVCAFRNLCRTCYGFNYNERGDVAHRDKGLCEMLLAENQVVSAYQINKLTSIATSRSLTDDETIALEAALLCYDKYQDFHFTEVD